MLMEINTKELNDRWHSTLEKYAFQLACSGAVLIVACSSYLLWGGAVSLWSTASGAIAGIWGGKSIERGSREIANLVLHQQRNAQLILAVLSLVVVLFFAPLAIFSFGLEGGAAISLQLRSMLEEREIRDEGKIVD